MQRPYLSDSGAMVTPCPCPKPCTIREAAQEQVRGHAVCPQHKQAYLVTLCARCLGVRAADLACDHVRNEILEQCAAAASAGDEEVGRG
jgi:hypothetical protein